jgi:AraC family transcriptional regulator, 4-hydroxyphenylacetate 3-monooxygenase operon regulatory protein
MVYQYHDEKIGALLAMTDHLQQDQAHFAIQEKLLRLVWNRNSEPVSFWADGRRLTLAPHELVGLTYLHHTVWEKNSLPLTAFAFNREFYCMQDHDNEVLCYGVLFFGAQHLPTVALPIEEMARYEMLYQIFSEEFKYQDKIQGEMLLALTKRLIIKTTRLAKLQNFPAEIEEEKLDIIRRFSFLVDEHYKEQKQVAFYANALHKSPKTLSNFFHLHSSKTPQQIIHERIALEAKRFLLFTDKSCKEIAYELGFEEANHFSKFFKKMFEKTPLAFRKQYKNT